eukprot:GDKI01010071.1.p1 GENE.GDKI01010071.1~~GDKI01010071.1.p1  ORF type:complete len:257 (-),score=58.89 GDKI01010071.1:127-897(-)
MTSLIPPSPETQSLSPLAVPLVLIPFVFYILLTSSRLFFAITQLSADTQKQTDDKCETATAPTPTLAHTHANTHHCDGPVQDPTVPPTVGPVPPRSNSLAAFSRVRGGVTGGVQQQSSTQTRVVVGPAQESPRASVCADGVSVSDGGEEEVGVGLWRSASYESVRHNNKDTPTQAQTFNPLNATFPLYTRTPARSLTVSSTHSLKNAPIGDRSLALAFLQQQRLNSQGRGWASTVMSENARKQSLREVAEFAQWQD